MRLQRSVLKLLRDCALHGEDHGPMWQAERLVQLGLVDRMPSGALRPTARGLDLLAFVGAEAPPAEDMMDDTEEVAA